MDVKRSVFIDGFAVDENELERRLRETYGVEVAAIVYAYRKTQPQRERMTIIYESIAMKYALHAGMACPVA